MKKRLLALMLVVATVVLTACGNTPAYTPGVFTETGYESEYLGFRFTTPEGFTLSTEEELASAMDESLEVMGDDISEIQKKYAEITVIYEMMVANSTGLVNANITLEKLMKSSMSVDEYIEAFRTSVESVSTMDIALDETISDAQVAGSDYKVATAAVSYMGVEMTQTYYFRKVGDRMMTLTVTAYDGTEDDVTALMNGFAAY